MKQDELNINTLRMLGVDMITKAKSGHPGIVLGAAPIVYTLFTRFINIDPDDPTWWDRDRFVLSAGHGCRVCRFDHGGGMYRYILKKPDDSYFHCDAGNAGVCFFSHACNV